MDDVVCCHITELTKAVDNATRGLIRRNPSIEIAN